MSSRPSGPASRQVRIALCLIALSMALAVVYAGTAKAADFRAVLCAAENGSNSYGTATNTTSSQNPGGIFSYENYCGPAPFPAGDGATLRIAENQPNGNAGQGAYGDIYYDTPPAVHFREAGGYTRQPFDFNEGWRERFWIAGGSAGNVELLSQGLGAPQGRTTVFSPHLWPIGGYLDFTRFVFELECVRPGGCDRSGSNAADANTFVFTLADESPSQVSLTNAGGPMMEGRWVRGEQTASYQFTEVGSGIRMESLYIDGTNPFTIDHASECDVGFNGAIGLFARSFQPCATASNPIPRWYNVNTSAYADGAHTLRVCTWDFAQWQGYNGNGGASCDQRTILTDNTPPGAPAGLEVTSANPARYLQRFGAKWQLPPNQGSPIAAVHYDIVNAAGNVVVPERTVSATNPSALSEIEGPKSAGDYRLRLWLEDSVGFIGPVATAPIPHDTTPPAAPQSLAAIGPESWGPAQGYSLRWQNVADNGSPIVAAYYQVLDGSGKVVEATKTLRGEGVNAVPALDTPRESGDYSARVWLEDEERNVGAAATTPLPRDTTPPAAPQDLSVTSPDDARSSEGFDVHWRNIVDSGSAITAVHYQVLDGNGDPVVPTQTITGTNPQAIADLDTPSQQGDYTLRLWLSDAEGNQSAPAKAPLAYDCVRADNGNGQAITAGLGRKSIPELTVGQKDGATLTGRLTGAGKLGETPICVFSRVVTDQARDFLGLAVTAADGSFNFAIGKGPSREITAIYRSGQRELSANTTLQARVHPTLRLKQKVVRNGSNAVFKGSVPGPHAIGVVVVLQVKDGKGWRVFRRYRTHSGGRFVMRYRFTQTFSPTTYVMRAEVPGQSGFPYEEGSSKPIEVPVKP